VIAPIAMIHAAIGAIVAIARPIAIGPVVTNGTSHPGSDKPVVAQNMACDTTDDGATEAARGVRRTRR